MIAMSEQRTAKGVRAIVTDEDVVTELRTATTGGRLRQWARSHRISPSYVSDVLRGARAPGEKIRSALGFEQVLVRKTAGNSEA